MMYVLNDGFQLPECGVTDLSCGGGNRVAAVCLIAKIKPAMPRLTCGTRNVVGYQTDGAKYSAAGVYLEHACVPASLSAVADGELCRSAVHRCNTNDLSG